MKKIYSFTLDSDDYTSICFMSNLRLIAYLLYDSIYNYDGENVTALNINKNIIYNNINENGSYYYLDSDLYDDNNINYEPFILGNRTFCLTIDDDVMNEDTIKELLELEQHMANLSYKIHINSEGYYSKNKDDERFRFRAINTLCSKLGCNQIKRSFLDNLLGWNYNKRRNAMLVRKY